MLLQPKVLAASCVLCILRMRLPAIAAALRAAITPAALDCTPAAPDSAADESYKTLEDMPEAQELEDDSEHLALITACYQ
jgi:hypothetical protein